MRPTGTALRKPWNMPVPLDSPLRDVVGLSIVVASLIEEPGLSVGRVREDSRVSDSQEFHVPGAPLQRKG